MSGPIRAPLTVETEDGSVEGRPITTIKVSNGDLTISGNVASIDTTGSGSVPGGSDTEIQYNNAGAFGGDAGLKITTKGGGSTTTIQSGNVLLGGNKLATGIANGSLFLTTDGTGQVYIQSGTDQGGTFTDTQVNIKSNTNTDNAILNFGDSSNPTNGRITLKDDGNLEIKNSVSGKNVFLEVAGSAGVTVKQGTTDTDVQLTVEGNGTGTPKISLTNSTKAVTMLCDVNQKLKVEGGTNSFVLDVSSGTGGITFPDGTTQTTAASGGGGSTTFGRGSVSNTALGTSVSTFGTIFTDQSTGDRAVSDYNTPGAFPLVAQEKGDVASFTMRVTQASAGDNVLVGFYNSTNGLPDTLIGSCSIPTDSTGYITQTTFSTTISLDAGETYWLVYGNDDNSTSANVRRLTSTSSFGIVETDSQEYPFSGYTHSGTTTSLPATFAPTAGRFFRPLAYYTVS